MFPRLWLNDCCLVYMKVSITTAVRIVPKPFSHHMPWSCIFVLTHKKGLFVVVFQTAAKLSIPYTGLSEFSLLFSSVIFYRATACNATCMVLLSQFCPSVCPSIRCVYCDKTKQHTANILIPHETAITLVFWHQQWLVGDAPFPLKSALKVTHPHRKNANFDRFPLITSQP